MARSLQGPKLLNWKLDSRLKNSIDEAKENAVKLSVDIVLKRKPFRGFGKVEIQKLKVNPDTFVQMALQLAYYRLHKKPGFEFDSNLRFSFILLCDKQRQKKFLHFLQPSIKFIYKKKFNQLE